MTNPPTQTPASVPGPVAVPAVVTPQGNEVIVVVRSGALHEIELETKYLKLWEDTRVGLLWHCPAFSHILYTMLNKKGMDHIALFTDDPRIWCAATDGSNLILNPAKFFSYNLMERVFICAHEIMHCILGHMEMSYKFQKRGKVALANGKTLDYDDQLMNQAMDFVINAILVDSKVGTFNTDWLHDTAIATANDSVVDIYAKLFKQGGGKGGKQQFDVHMAPGAGDGKDPTQASQDRNESEWQTQVAAALQAARVQGKLPAGIDRALGQVLSPKVEWRDHIQSLFARAIGSDNVDWRKPVRQYIVQDIYVPETTGYGAELVVVAVDTSGSIGQAELDMFFGELSGILEDVRPERIQVVWCDAKVHRVDELQDGADLVDLRTKRAPGGGGTDFRPVFDYVDKQGVKCDALVYLTDGYGSFPEHAPNYPVIWGDIAKNKAYPFGEIVEIPRA